MSRTIKAYLSLVHFSSELQSIILFLIRVYWGYWFFRSGWIKLGDIDCIAGYFLGWHIPCPHFSAILVGIVHFFGGICLILGLFARLASIPLGITMLVAYYAVHHAALADVNKFVQEPPFLFFLTSVVILLYGPGKYSFDCYFFNDCCSNIRTKK